MNQNNGAEKYLKYNYLIYLLAGIQVICFFLPVVKYSYVGEGFTISPAKLMTGISDIDYIDLKSGAAFFLIVPAILIFVIWILKNVKKIKDDVAMIICLISVSCQLTIDIFGSAFMSISKKTLSDGTHIGIGLILSWICTVLMMVIFVMIMLKKLNPEDVLIKTAEAGRQPVQPQSVQQPVQPQSVQQPVQQQPVQSQPEQSQPEQSQPVQPQPVQQPVQQPVIFCVNCGTKLAAGTKFCTKCGTKIEE
jgi:hypothetical protein